MSTTNEVKGWFLSGSNPDSYVMKTDSEVFRTGFKSGYLGCVDPTMEAMEDQFGTMMQMFSAENWIGKRIKMSGCIKTKNVMKCRAWCCIGKEDGDIIQFDNMDNRYIQGTTDWNDYSIVLDVPEESESIHFGILLVGSGEVWVDSVKFEEVDENVPSTNMNVSAEGLPLTPVNLDFDEF